VHPLFQELWEAEWDAAMPVGYCIDADHVTGDMDLPTRVGTVSRGWCADVDALATLRFRLRDDDGGLLFEGRCVDDDDALSQDAALSFGMNDAGATTVEVLRGWRWVTEIG